MSKSRLTRIGGTIVLLIVLGYIIGYWLPFNVKISSLEKRGVIQNISIQEAEARFEYAAKGIPLLDIVGTKNIAEEFSLKKTFNPIPFKESMYEVDYTPATYTRVYDGNITYAQVHAILDGLKSKGIESEYGPGTGGYRLLQNEEEFIRMMAHSGFTVALDSQNCTDYSLIMNGDSIQLNKEAERNTYMFSAVATGFDCQP